MEWRTEHAGRTHAKLLTSRDHEILRFVGTQGVAAIEQLARRFWPNARMSTAQDRLTQLARVGYLLTERCHLRDARKPGELVYCLTRKGLLPFSPSERPGLEVGLPPTNDIKHRLLATEVRLRLEEQLRAEGDCLIGWVGERALRADCGREVARQVTKSAITVTDAPATGASKHGGGGGRRRKVSGRTTLDIADARVVVQDRDGAIREIDIEIDGQYYGKMLQAKARGLGSSSP